MEVRVKERVKAPVKVGDKVGEILVYKDNVEIDVVDVVAAESAEAAGVGYLFKEIARKWNFR